MFKLIAAATALTCLTYISSANAGPKGNAQNSSLLCRVIEKHPMNTESCSISVWDRTVTGTLDMTPADARLLCFLITNNMRSEGKTFDEGWKLQIRSPYSGDKNIAYCDL